MTALFLGYSSFARACRLWGDLETSRPRAFAVLRLITSSSFVDCWTGNTDLPPRTRPTQAPTRMTPFRYMVHGLMIGSELELPELAPLGHDPRATIDVIIRLGRLPPEVRTCTEIPDFQKTDHGPLLVLPGAGRFLVRPSSEVTIEIADNADLALLRLFLFGSVMGLVCHQLGMLPLHASAVAVGDRAIAFCGPQGMGKSTLAAACIEAGASLVADDMLVVTTNPENAVMAKPGMPKVKLWRDAIDALGLPMDGLVRDWARAEKFHVPASHHLVDKPVRLERIIVLEADEYAGAGITAPLSGAAAVSALVQNTYRPEYLDLTPQRTNHFAQCVRLSSLTTIARLTRQRDARMLAQTARMLLDTYLAPP